MTKKEIVRKISDDLGKTQLETKEIVQRTLDAIIETLISEGQIELRNFGIFKVKRRAPRKARNPRTGERVSVPPKNVVTFKPGKEMEEKVREMDPANLPYLDDEDFGFEGAASVPVPPPASIPMPPQPSAAKRASNRATGSMSSPPSPAPVPSKTTAGSAAKAAPAAKTSKKAASAAPASAIPSPSVEGKANTEAAKPKRARKSTVS